MMARKINILAGIFACFFCVYAKAAVFTTRTCLTENYAKELGWVESKDHPCGGYYLEQPLIYPNQPTDRNLIQITSNEGLLFSARGTSISQGLITIVRGDQQISASRAFLYRDPETGKPSSADLMDHVTFREPNNLIIAHSAFYDLETNGKLLKNIFYRIAVYGDLSNKKPPSRDELKKERKIAQLSAWGKADEFRQTIPNIYYLENASYSTCPPTNTAWKVNAGHIVLNRETGRGYARNASISVKGIPVFYTPYLNFPIDNRRQTGFLWPTIGTSSKSGAYFSAPYYINLAPNYDTTLTPTILGKRGLEISDLYRYMNESNEGKFNIAILPNDRMFDDFQQVMRNTYGSSTDPTTIAELNRLDNASTTRKSFYLLHHTHFNDHWSGDVDFNWVSDDYYLRDLSTNLNEVTQNQLLQKAELNYKGQNWNFLGRVQSYQTLHPVDESTYQNQYSRFPQLALNGDYPDMKGGFEYFINNEFTRFDIRDTPGVSSKFPMGDRLNVQPGINYPYQTPNFYFDPRLQFAFTQYQVGDVLNNNSKTPRRALPIFDINTGLYFDRNLTVFGKEFRQTLEPELYYTYVPYRNQNQIPVFDTTVNTLTYDQLFTYNRFSGIDRIGDANQISAGITTRFVDQQTGFEKFRMGVGQIYYFQSRRVTLCTDASCGNVPICNGNNGANCTDYPSNPNNKNSTSPFTGILNYNFNPNWSMIADVIWNSRNKRLDNQSVTLHFQPVGTQQILNLGYNFVRQGDVLPGDSPSSSASNLSQTDVSFNWPFVNDWSMVGRWTQNWNHKHFQNLLYGLQYDSCCWAVRFVTGRAFTNLNPNNTYQYNTEFFVQFALKGLGNVGSRDPSQRLSSSIYGYQSNFGRDF
jgi:LPS-assembly protein